VVANNFQQSQSRDEFDLPDTLGNGAINTTGCERWSMPTDFGVHYRQNLAAMNNMRVLIDYHVVDLRLNDDLQSVNSVKLMSHKGRPIHGTAEVFILATGGIENARLLLASRGQIAGGVGNHSDMVGRCYMSHHAGTYGYLRLKDKRKPLFYRLDKDRNGTYYRRRFRLTDQAQRDLQVMNIIGFPCRPNPADPNHCDAVLSMMYLRDYLTHTPGALRPTWGLLSRHLANCVFSNPAAWVNAARQMWLRSQRPRLPFILPYSRRAQDALFFQVEHAPNLESRLLLSDERDDFGVPRIKPSIRFSDIDFRTVTEFYRQLDQGLRAEQLGHLDYDEPGLKQYLDHLATNFNSIAHHLGTTRMSADPKLGVVASDCKVHSVTNLYITGSSVFPTSGHANPTLTMLALVLRLAIHLLDRFSPSLEGVTGRPQRLHAATGTSTSASVSLS
jgi:choline dehydrogenase-like flavoprotein